MAKGDDALTRVVQLLNHEWSIGKANAARAELVRQGKGTHSQEVQDIDCSVQAMLETDASSAVQYREWQKGGRDR